MFNRGVPVHNIKRGKDIPCWCIRLGLGALWLIIMTYLPGTVPILTRMHKGNQLGLANGIGYLIVSANAILLRDSSCQVTHDRCYHHMPLQYDVSRPPNAIYPRAS